MALGGSPGPARIRLGLTGSSREVPRAVLIRTVFIIRKSVVFVVWPQYLCFTYFFIIVVQKQYFFEFTTVIIINFLGPDLHLCYKNIMQTQHASQKSYGKHRRNLRHPLGSFF